MAFYKLLISYEDHRSTSIIKISIKSFNKYGTLKNLKNDQPMVFSMPKLDMTFFPSRLLMGALFNR